MVRRSPFEADAERSQRNGYAQLELLRPGEAADDPKLWAAARNDPRARAILLDDEGRGLCEGGALACVPLPAAQGDEPVLLGFRPDDGAPLFLAAGDGAAGGVWQDLRSASAFLAAGEASLWAFARALHLWHRSHRHCPACGAPTRSARAGHARECTRESCGKRHFPRIDPCIIALATQGGRCLLVRQPHWPPRRFSAIAGFVEPGETLEQAVRREIREEVGLATGAVSYHSSQPWPFPGSLMIAFRAEAEAAPLRLSAEIAEAAWWEPSRLLQALRAGELLIAPPWSVAHRLIRDFVEEAGLPWPVGGEAAGLR